MSESLASLEVMVVLKRVLNSFGESKVWKSLKEGLIVLNKYGGIFINIGKRLQES